MSNSKKLIFQYQHKIKKKICWTSQIFKNGDTYLHHSSMGVLAAKAFIESNQKFDSSSFKSREDSFNFFTQFNKYWSSKKNKLLSITNLLDLEENDMKERWEKIHKLKFVTSEGINHAGFQHDWGIILELMQEKILNDNPKELLTINQTRFEELLQDLNLPEAWDFFLDIYNELKAYEFTEAIEDNMTLGVIRNPHDFTLKMMIVVQRSERSECFNNSHFH